MYHLPTEVAFAEAESKPLFSGTVIINNKIIAVIAFSIIGLIIAGGVATLITIIYFRCQIRRVAQNAIGDVQEAATPSET